MDGMAKKPPPEQPPFEKFKALMKRLVAVPKKEVDEKQREYREREPE